MERDIIMYIEAEISYYLNGLVSRNMALMIFDYQGNEYYILGLSIYLFSDAVDNFELEYYLDLCG